MKSAVSRINLAVYILIRIVIIAGGIRALTEGHIYTAFQCLLSLFLYMLPSILNRRFSIELPDPLELAVILFIFASTFLGEVYDYYEQFPLWDSLLHASSGFLSAAIGFSMIDILNRSERVKFSLSPGFAALFAFCFSMTIGAFWEFYEFGMDMIFHTDMQKDTLVHTIHSTLLDERVTVGIVTLGGQQLNGWLDIGLIDTMKDLLVNAAGAAVFSIFGWLYVKNREAGWIEHLLLRRKKM